MALFFKHLLMTANPMAYFFIMLDAVKVSAQCKKKIIKILILFHESVTVPSRSVCPPVPLRHLHGLAVNYIPSPSKSLPPSPHRRQRGTISLSDLYPFSAAWMAGAVSSKRNQRVVWMSLMQCTIPSWGHTKLVRMPHHRGIQVKTTLDEYRSIRYKTKNESSNAFFLEITDRSLVLALVCAAILMSS